MDFLNKTWQQAAELFRSFTPAGRITAGLLLVAIVVSLFFLFRVDVGGHEDLFDRRVTLSPKEVIALESAFAQSSLPVSKTINDRILVPQGKKFDYLEAAAEYSALPRSTTDYVMDALTRETTFGVGSSDRWKQRVNHSYELMLGRIISEINGIEDAHVRFEEELVSRLPRRMEKKALVSARAVGHRDLGEKLKQAIRTTVAGYYVGLVPQSITVVDLNAGDATTGNDGLDERRNLYIKSRRAHEDEWRNKITGSLKMYEGVVVEVSVELNPMIDRREQTVKLGQSINIETEERRSTTGRRPIQTTKSRTEVGNQGRVVAQHVGMLEESTTRSKSVPGKTETTSEYAGLTPTRVRASIGVPRDLFAKIWHTRSPGNGPASPDVPSASQLLDIEQKTITQIRSTVEGLLPDLADGSGDLSAVTVTTYERFQSPPEVAPTRAEAFTEWLLFNWQPIALLLLGVTSLLVLRRFAMAAPEPEPHSVAQTTGYEEDAVRGDEIEELVGDDGPQMGTRLRSQLADIVRDDPDAAAKVIRNWIGDAA